MESFGALFGRLVRNKRGVEGLSQDALAGMANLTKARISDIENGKIDKPQIKTIDALCVALNITTEERNACRVNASPDLPPRLLENLALRFGHTNPDASEDELEAFLKEKAIEFRELQNRLAQIEAADSRIAEFLTAANAALEEGDFQLADKRLAEAEEIQLTSITLPALERQHRLRFERGHTALLGGEIQDAAQHWERSANYFHFVNEDAEAEKRFEYCTRLREYGYRYRSAEALQTARNALEKNLNIWTKAGNLQNWCRVTNALGATSWRLSQFDDPKNFLKHMIAAKSLYESVHESCSGAELPFYYAASSTNLASIYSDREFSKSDEEYYANLILSLDLQSAALELTSKLDRPVEWGIQQHNIGLTYTKIFREQADKHLSMTFIDKAIHHLELSFDVRDPGEMLQYWIASCRSLGEALVERSMHQPNSQAKTDLQRAKDLLSEAASKITEAEHPNQWAEIQRQLERCTN
ncbi:MULTISPECIES: helix-turn-helix domain-containing protein [Bradyrhizobium]|jgi:transcriptional regulator with XRE-family HTH domain|uniref:Transcriptional regulator, contains XRE-family HTH domain n=2 Tax=Bradyrhizobium TaxID=374 RepID=A0ABY0P7E8_9BRAD|nr:MULTISPECIES: helix-turn-helix transcriptional regulator [Bradyrhizobium]SDH51753.1 Transcriptional regulator, contains XRE-family HTH domain [Bradyrhizobium ottawaense]SEE26896.1 Transcriptional regulator, contains XRE-family HTH domain [Bradyrhizobium lablabi]